MKLKKLTARAKTLNYAWLAVDSDKRAFGHIVRPELTPLQWSAHLHTPSCRFIGMYTGNKDWTTTLRQVQQDGTTR